MSAKEERPAATCTECGFAWHTAAMIEGLRLLGSCPHCKGELRFDEAASDKPERFTRDREVPPHLALGLPRPPRRE